MSDYLHVENLIEHPPLDERGIQSRTLQDTDQFRLVLFTFGPGKGLKSHSTPHPVTLTFLQGAARVTVGSGEVHVSQGALLSLPPSLEHSIQAATELVMFLTMIK